MDLNEAAERIFKYHWVLILLTTILGLSVPLVLAQQQEDSYVASARIDMGAQEVRDGEQAAGIADAALAIATSPGVLDRALTAAGAQGPQALLETLVQVEPVGASTVVQLSVTHPDAAASAKIVNALATEVVTQRTDAVLGDSDELAAQLDEQIAAVAATITAIEAEANAAAQEEARLRAQGLNPGSLLNAIELRYSQAVRQLDTLQQRRGELTDRLAEAPRPVVTDAAGPEGLPVETSLVPRLAAGALLGLILGIALAATLEAWRPTLGPAALARHLGVPLLGSLPRLPRTAGELPDRWLNSYVTLAADNAGVRSFELIPVGANVDVAPLARSLVAEAGGGTDIVPVALDGPHDTQLPTAGVRAGTGIIVVAPKRVKSASLANLERHVHLTRQPVIGVIAYGKGGGQVKQTVPTTAPAPAAAPGPPSASPARPAVPRHDAAPTAANS